MKLLLPVLLLALPLFPSSASAEDEAAGTHASGGLHFSRFGAGDGPELRDGALCLLDDGGTTGQSNAVALDRPQEGAAETLELRCRLRVLEGGDGGAFIFLSTADYGARGPAPFVRSWVEPNLTGTFAVGIDVHNPPNEEPFGPWGNYQGLPEREVSLHFDGREIVKRVAPAEFRGDFADVEIIVSHVTGGAEVTVRIAGEAVYSDYFIAGLLPYEARLAIGAGTRADAATRFDVMDLAFMTGAPATPRRPPLHVEVFHHVMTDNSRTAYEAEVDLPPPNWAFGRVILTLDIHDGGRMWDEWDRNGEVSIVTEEGERLAIVPFITSYRTPCHWAVDVTPFRPLLTGRTKFEIRAGTNFYQNRGYLMSVSLDFHHGNPALQPYRVVPLWAGNAHYRSSGNHFQDFFAPRTVTIDAETRAARIFNTTTGHSQVGEFTPSARTLTFVPDREAEQVLKHRFENVLWKADCYLNPNRPQYGTWKYSRAGWAPGDIVRPWWIDLTPMFLPGKVAEFRYTPEPYDFGDSPQRPTEEQINQALHAVFCYLILYRDAVGTVPAPVVMVTNVAAGSNASKGGMKPGDFLATYDGKRVDSIDDLRLAIEGAIASNRQQVVVVVFRGAERIELELDPGRMGVNLSVQ